MTATIAVLSLLLPPVAPPSPAVSQPRQPAVSVSAPIQATSWPPPAPAVLSGMADAAKWGRVTPRPAPTPFYDYPKETPWTAISADEPSGSIISGAGSLSALPAVDGGIVAPPGLNASTAPLSAGPPLTVSAWDVWVATVVSLTGQPVSVVECIGTAESSRNQFAVGLAGERGFGQVHPLWLSRWFSAIGRSDLAQADPFDPVSNAEMVAAIWWNAGGSWTPWTTRRQCGAR